MVPLATQAQGEVHSLTALGTMSPPVYVALNDTTH
jgi:hypothetical protein